MMDLQNRGQFLNIAAFFEGGLALLAFGLAWIAGIDLGQWLVWDWRAAGWGVIATLPLLVLFSISYGLPWRPLRTIRRFLVETLGPSLAACRWYDLILLALLAGVCEELLFRGVLQPWFERAMSPAAALVASNVLFGLAHFVTTAYAVLAALMGMYLGSLLDLPWLGERSLLVPIVTHSTYDFLAFVVVRRSWIRQRDAAPEAPGEPPPLV